jgi:hypothetical protein
MSLSSRIISGAMLEDMLEASGGAAEPHSRLAPDIEAVLLRDSLASFSIKHHFTVGQIVRQKLQAVGYRKFGDNDHAIVVAILDEPIVVADSDKTCGSPHFREPMDLVVGCFEDGGGKFLIYHVDSRRFEPVEDFTSGLV